MKDYIDQRLDELSAEATTEKQAGFNYVWSSFLSNVFESGYDEAVRSASLTKFAGDDDFTHGQNKGIDFILSGSQEENLKELKLAYDKQEVGKDFVDLAFYGEQTMETYEMAKEAALNEIEDLFDSGSDVHDILDVVQETLSQPLDKYASEEDEYHRLGIEALCYDFLKQASDSFAEHESYDFGKTAALEEMVDFYEQGADIYDVMDVVRETLTQPLDKYASEEDEQYRLGIESACYEFLKSASDVFGEYEVGPEDGEIALEVALEKIAAGSDPRSEKLRAAVERNKKSKKYQSGKSKGQDFKRRMKNTTSTTGRAKNKLEDVSKSIKGMDGRKALVAGGLGAAGLGAAALGAHKLKKRRDAKKEQGQKKAASLHFEFDEIEEAVMALQEAGFEIE